jgi:hypothetical protein
VGEAEAACREPGSSRRQEVEAVSPLTGSDPGPLAYLICEGLHVTLPLWVFTFSAGQ